MVAAEIDFPRGGAAEYQEEVKKTSKRRNSGADKFAFKKKRTASDDVNKDSDEFGGVWKRTMTVQFLNESLLGLGIIREIYDLEILLETADGTVVSLPGSNISEKLIKATKEMTVTLHDLFTVGQMIAFKVVAPSANSDNKKGRNKRSQQAVVVSCNPSVVNSHLGATNIFEGLVLNGCIESVEEKGAIIDLGFSSSKKGFLPFTELPNGIQQASLIPGKVMLLRIHKNANLKKSRVIALSGVIEADTLEESTVKKLNKNMLMPGTLVYGKPINTSKNYIDLGNNVVSHIANCHLPMELQKGLEGISKPFRCIVTFCQQNSNVLTVSGNPDIVAVSDISRRIKFNGLKVGDTVACTVASTVKNGAIIFKFGSNDKKKVTFIGLGRKKYLEPGEYKTGEEYSARIIGYRYFQRQLLLATKRDILAQKFIGIKDALPGEKVSGVVESVKSSGVYVRIYNSIRGFIPAMHLADKFLHKPEKHFKPKRILKCKVLYTDKERQRLVLTCRPSFLKDKTQPLASFSTSYIGSKVLGVISSIRENGALVVSFYGNVAGYMPKKEASLINKPKVGASIHVKVLKVEPDSERMLLGAVKVSTDDDVESDSLEALSNKHFSEEQSTSRSNGIKNDIFGSKVKVKNFTIYHAKVKGLWTRGVRSDSAIELELPGGTIGRLHGSELDDESLNASPVPVKKFVDDKKGRTILVKVIGFSKIREKRQEASKLSKAVKIRPVKDAKSITRVQRVAECTISSKKLNETRKKTKLLGYKASYTQGEFIPVFVCGRTRNGAIQVEATPVWKGLIEKQNLRQRDLKVNETDKNSSLIDFCTEPGQLLEARVVGIYEFNKSKSKRRKSKTLKLTVTDIPKTLNKGDKVIGRVVRLASRPSSVIFKLINGQRAILTPTGVTGYYRNSLKRLSSFVTNEIYYVELLHFSEKGRYWSVVTGKRYHNQGLELQKKNYSKLIIDVDDIKVDTLVKGFISKITGKVVIVEIGPGIFGNIIKKNLQTEPLKSATKFSVDQVIEVKVTEILDGEHIILAFVKAITEAEEEVIESRKRTLSNMSDMSTETPLKKLGPKLGIDKKSISDVGFVSAKIDDPGFDWSLKGFTPADFAAVGNISKGLNDGQKLTGNSKVKLTYKDQEISKSIMEEDLKQHSLTQQQVDFLKEKEIIERENALLQIHENPTSENHFDILVTGSPNSSDLWIQYMAFFLAKKDVQRAREIAERALSVINFREEDEIFNVWTAYLNLECTYGTAETLKDVFERAIKNVDSLKMHKQMFKIYQKAEKVEENDELLEKMLKKFRHDDMEVWALYGQHLMSTGRAEKARELLKKAMKSLQIKNHVPLLSRFAQFEFKLGDPEQGKTIFESILSSYPKKTDVWTVYIDLTLKKGSLDETRKLYERITSYKLSSHKMRQFFKRWLNFEEKYGNEETQKMVKEKAVQYVDDFLKKTES